MCVVCSVCVCVCDSLFLLFVDLKKAYDSVPRNALWMILEKCGVPTRMLGRFMRECMQKFEWVLLYLIDLRLGMV